MNKLILITALILGSALQAMDVGPSTDSQTSHKASSGTAGQGESLDKKIKKDPAEQLLVAIRYNNYQMTEDLLAQGAPVDAKDQYGETPLIHAAAKRRASICQLLLNYNAQVDAKSNIGWPVLLYAVQNNHKEICELLLTHHAHVDIRNRIEQIPLMEATANNNKDICKLLIAHNAQVDAQDYYGSTSLMYAAHRGHTDICKLFIDAMLIPKKQHAKIFALCKGMKNIGRSRDERYLVSQCAFSIIRQQNKPKVLVEIAKIQNKTLKDELIQYVQSKSSNNQ